MYPFPVPRRFGLNKSRNLVKKIYSAVNFTIDWIMVSGPYPLHFKSI